MKNRNKQTKFPVARIKKIMQKDEEVGKVAQATPVVISKALEMFLSMIVDEAAKVTLDRNSKRVEAYHLKHAVEHTDMLDFLKEIVAGVPDPSAGGTIDIEAEKNEAKKRRAQGAGTTRKRRKKSSAADTDAGGDDGEGSGGGGRKRSRSRAGWVMERNGGMDEEDGDEADADLDADPDADTYSDD